MIHVCFRYSSDGPLVLDDVSFRAKPGEFIALAGDSGSGKSTLLRLLLGFESAESSGVYYDGQDLSGMDFRAFRRQIGVVLQSGRIMAGDIFRNIVGSSNLTIDDALEDELDPNVLEGVSFAGNRFDWMLKSLTTGN